MIDITYYNNANHNLDESNKLLEAIEHVKDSIKSSSWFYSAFLPGNAIEQSLSCKEYVSTVQQNFSHLIVVGMGGALLNPKMILSLIPHNTKIDVHFIDNTDPIFLKSVLDKVSIRETAIVGISNSGNTVETNTLIGVLISEYRNAGIDKIWKHFYFITKPDSMLGNIATKISATLISHPNHISGRYSTMSQVVTLLAQIVGINTMDYITGASLAQKDFFEHRFKSSIVKSASFFLSNNDKSISVNMGYLQKFNTFLEWYCQIISESLGKNEDCITPIRGLGPNDQHSMLQLYLDGPNNKIYNLFYVEDFSHCNNYSTPNDMVFSYISDRNLSFVNTVNFRATLNALISKGYPVRTIMLNDFSAKSVGYFIMHSILEILMIARITKTSPFDQPAIEKLKDDIRKMME